jgi:hypothetical protein
MGPKDDYRRRLLASDPRELARAVADFGPEIGIALETVRARDPLEQPLTAVLRLYAADGRAVGRWVAVDDMREDQPQTEIVAQTRSDGNRVGGTGRLVNGAQDGFHHGLLRTSA